MKRTVIAQQGEAKVFRITSLPKKMETKEPQRNADGAAIISHSERGHHHIIADADVLERVDNVPAGMAILYAIVKSPTALRQDAPHPHAEIPLDVGLYEIRVGREFNPFEEQARRIAD